MQSSKMQMKDGQTVDLVDSRISDANIASWEGKQDAIPDAGSAAKPVHFKDGKAVAGDSINNCKLTLKVGDATVGDGFTANAGADFEYRVTGEQIASALTAGSGIAISGKTVSTNLPLSNDKAVTVKKNVWYIFAMSSIPSGGVYERCWDFLIASNHNSAAQMRLFISPRISASGNFESDSVIQVEGHVTPAQLAKYKLATVKDSSGNLYCCLCVNHSHSNENRTVQWNLRNARGPSWWGESSPLSNYTVVSERLLSKSMSSNRLVCYKPTNNAAVGNSTRPVYVDADGRIQACSGTLDTSGGQSLVPTGNSTVPVFINSTGSPDECDVPNMIVGGANVANMLSSGNTGNTTLPVYFAGGKPVACTGGQLVEKWVKGVQFVIDDDGVKYNNMSTSQCVNGEPGVVSIWMRKSTSASATEAIVTIVRNLMVFRTGNHGIMSGNFCPRPRARSDDDSD